MFCNKLLDTENLRHPNTYHSVKFKQLLSPVTKALIYACSVTSLYAHAEVIGGVEFPAGTLSFADTVIAYNPDEGLIKPSPENQDTDNALGAPQMPDNTTTDSCISGSVCHHVSLGDGGSITLSFTNNVLTGSDSPEKDLWVFEAGADSEQTLIEISRDRVNWQSVGTTTGRTSGIDIDAYGFGTSDWFSYVRLTDKTNNGPSTGLSVGADIDGVGVISSQAISALKYLTHVESGKAMVKKKINNNYQDWLTFGPLSKPQKMPAGIKDAEAVTGIVENWGWLLVSDRYSVYKASYTDNTGKWNIARRVWNLGNTSRVISSMVHDQKGVHVNWVNVNDASTGSITLSLSDIKIPSCDLSAASTFFDKKDMVNGTSFYFNDDNLPVSLMKGIEIIPGTLPIIISAPHQGALSPAEIDLFDPNGLISDGGSLTAAKLLADRLQFLTGKRPHLIINNIERRRLMLNISDARDNQDPEAIILRDAYYYFLRKATDYVSQACGKGLLIDMHTNGFNHGKNVLGLALDREDINDVINNDYDRSLLVRKSTIRHLLESTQMPIKGIVVGDPISKMGLGDLVNGGTGHTIPNSQFGPLPANQYFNGGRIVRDYGSRNMGTVDAIQIENHWKFINKYNGSQTRIDYINNELAPGVISWMENYYGFILRK